MAELKPFSPNDADLRVDTDVRRDSRGESEGYSEVLLVSFTVSGEVWDLRWPEKDTDPSRHDELWKTTCFELFLAAQSPDTRYWEVNLSPSCNWNTYSFESYRKGMKMETRLHVSSIDFKREDTRVVLKARIDLSPLMLGNQPLDISATAILQDDEEHTSYWALKHCGQKEDFHLRESFILKI
jgi:hypothetical protein